MFSVLPFLNNTDVYILISLDTIIKFIIAMLYISRAYTEASSIMKTESLFNLTQDKFVRNLDWNLLYTFMIIVQEKKLTNAADRLFVTQPAVSLALKRLEKTLDVQLLERGNKFEMTLAGETVYKEVCKVFSSIARLPGALEEAPKYVSGLISIATISQVMSEDLDEELSAFFSDYPKAELSISTMTGPDIIRAVELGRVTIGICGGIIPENLTKKKLRQEDFGLFCGSMHPLFKKEKISIDDLRGEPFVCFTADVFGGQHMNEVTAQRAKSSIGQYVRGQSSNVHELRRMIKIGLGIGYLPLHLATDHEKIGQLRRLPPYDEVPSADIFLICNPETNFSPAERLFLKQFINIDL